MDVGQIVEFEYPEQNAIGAPAEWRRRRVLVTAVRRLRQSPLRPVTVALDPLRRRGSTLVTGLDLDLGAERSFYVESMRGRSRATWLGLATFDPLDPDAEPGWHPWWFAPTPRELRFLAEVCERFRRLAEVDHEVLRSVGVFPRDVTGM